MVRARGEIVTRWLITAELSAPIAQTKARGVVIRDEAFGGGGAHVWHRGTSRRPNRGSYDLFGPNRQA